jgi:hypothetical protein
MTRQANQQVAEVSIDGWPEHVRVTGKALSARILEGFVAWSERRAATIVYAELSKLSDAELERRGFARGDLHRQVFKS